MPKKRHKSCEGFTLIELILTIVMAAMILFGIGIVLADAIRGYRNMWNRVNSGVVVDGYVARRAFDAVVRKSTIEAYYLGDLAEKVAVYYYSDAQDLTIEVPDRFAYFKKVDDTLKVDRGTIPASQWDQLNVDNLNVTSTQTLANKVQSVEFLVDGFCVQMILAIGNESDPMTITCSSVRHNGG